MDEIIQGEKEACHFAEELILQSPLQSREVSGQGDKLLVAEFADLEV